MKAILTPVICCLLIGFAWATVTPFQQVGIGHFSGKLGIHTEGDTLAFVYNASRQSYPYDIGMVVLKRSYDAGQNWVSFVKPNLKSNCQRPTLFWSQGEILINYMYGFSTQVARSNDNGNTWQNMILGRTFEKSPYMERSNGVFKRFSLDLPYPEYDQNNYSVADQEELPSPMLFLNNTETTNATPTYFYGPDVIHGPVYTNSDIWIKQSGGGSNSGWPTFYAPVITAGEIHAFSGVIPYDEVFLGGYIEHAPNLEVPDTAPIRAHAQVVGPSVYDPNKIMMVTVNGGTYEAMLGTIINPDIQHAWVYASYPADPLGDPLFRNTYAVSDTLWTPLPDGNATGILFTPNKLWIRGNFSGAQTWCSGDTIMIIGDITLSGTTPGTDPFIEPINTTDSVNLISEKSILLKYGYRDPVDSLRYHPLCRADNNPIYIYASLYALGDGQGNSHRDGVFSFEYQHPHPSVEALNVWGYYWDNIDLHRRRFPQTAAEPWPQSIDYPWYNPLWPEQYPYLERGTVQLWGSVHQRRKGFMHRSLYDQEYPSDGIWNPEIDYCGGTSAVSYPDPILGFALGTINYPGTTGNGVGYKKDFHPDHRTTLLSIDTNAGQESVWKLGMNLGTCMMYQDGWHTDSYYRKTMVRKTHSKVFNRRGNSALYATNDLLLQEVGNTVRDFSASTYGDGMIQSVALAPDGTSLVYQYDTIGTDTMRLKVLNPVTGSVAQEYVFPVTTRINDIAITPSGRKLLASYTNAQIELYELNEFNEPVLFDACPFPDPSVSAEALQNSRIYLSPSSNEILDIFLWVPYGAPAGENQPGTIYHARAINPSFADDPIAPELTSISLDAYPNPMRDDLSLRIELPKGVDHRVEIYNLRGQRVKTLHNGALDLEGSIGYNWDGCSENSSPCGKGIYLIRLVVDNKPIRVKRICRI